MIEGNKTNNVGCYNFTTIDVNNEQKLQDHPQLHYSLFDILNVCAPDKNNVI